MTEQEARDKLIENVAYELQQGAQAMRDWVAGLADLDPMVLAHQLAWSGSDIARSAEVEQHAALLRRYAGATGNKPTITEVRNWYADQVMRAAANPEQSTGPMHNYIERARLVAMARLLQRLDYYVANIEPPVGARHLSDEPDEVPA